MMDDLQAQNNQAQRIFYRQHYRAVLNYVLTRCTPSNCYEDAEEITNSTFAKALTRIDQYDHERGAIKTWLYGIARNEAKRYYQKNKPLPSAPSSPRHVSLSWEELTEPEELSLYMREIAGHALTDIACALGVSVRTVGTLRRTAKRKLKAAFKRGK